MGASAETVSELYASVIRSAGCEDRRKATVGQLVQLGVEIAREGREGRKIGTLFVVGDSEALLARSRPLLLDPLYGHPREVLQVDRPELRESIKELAQLDGAFIVDDDGTFVSAGRFVDVDLAEANFVPGLGTRHAAAASITRAGDAVAVVVSQSSVVRVYAGGEVRAEIIPELFLLSRERLLTKKAAVHQVPEAGVTLAVSEPEAAA